MKRSLERTRQRLTGESEALLANARELWQTVQREAKRADKSRASADAVKVRLEAAEHQVEALHREAHEALAAAGHEAAPAPLAAVVLGQRVRVADLGVEAEVASLPVPEGRLTLRRGSWNIQSHLSRLSAPQTDGASTMRPVGAPLATYTAPEAPSLEVDLRGKEVDEALALLDQGLDRAVIGGLSELRVIHGIGRGVLRAAVERHLRGHPQVATQRLGVVGETDAA